MIGGRRRNALLAVTAGVLLSASLSGIAAAEYTSARTVSPTYDWNAKRPNVAVDRQGDAFVVWRREPASTTPFDGRVQGRSLSRSGELGPLKLLSPDTHSARSPVVAVDDDGDAVVVWDGRNEDTARIFARRVSRSGSVGPLRTLSSAAPAAYFGAVAVDSDGDALVTWNEYHPEDLTTRPMARRFFRDGRLGPIIPLADDQPRAADLPVAAIDRQGDALIVWADSEQVLSRVLTADGSLGPERVLSPPLALSDRQWKPIPVVDRAGRGVVVWQRWNQDDGMHELWARFVTAAGEPASAVRLSRAGQDAWNHAAAGDLEGDATVCWHEGTAGDAIICRRISRTGTVGDRTKAASGEPFAVVADDDGDGALVYFAASAADPYDADLFGKRIFRSGSFGSRTKISRLNGGGDLVADASAYGRVVVLWNYQAKHGIPAAVATGP